jgi:hypothetical protein
MSNQYQEAIEKELATAREALRIGNDGMARVCARRAVGQAIFWYKTKYPRPTWGQMAMHQIRMVCDDPEFPDDIRAAALRLTTKINDRFTYPFSNDPLADAALIIAHVEQRVAAAGGI